MTNKTVKELVGELRDPAKIRADAWTICQQAATTLTQQAAEIEVCKEALREARELIVRRTAAHYTVTAAPVLRMIDTALTGGGPTNEGS